MILFLCYNDKREHYWIRQAFSFPSLVSLPSHLSAQLLLNIFMSVSRKNIKFGEQCFVSLKSLVVPILLKKIETYENVSNAKRFKLPITKGTNRNFI